MPQMTFAKANGICVAFGNPGEEVPGKTLIFPEHPSMIRALDYDLEHAKKSYIRNCVNNYHMDSVGEEDVRFISEETKSSIEFVKDCLFQMGVSCS